MLAEYNAQDAKKTALILGIPTDFIRKDYYVTLAIQAMTSIKNENFELIFQGGTSLSKGYRVINRMSEDIDFRLIHKNKQYCLSKNKRRNLLRDYRNSITEALIKVGFIVNQADIKVFYEGQLTRISALFQDSECITYLRPHVSIECFYGDILLPQKSLALNTLANVVLKKESLTNIFYVNCISLDETAAEKWVALTRRVANSKIKSKVSDKHLVRHVYDLHQLYSKQLLNGKFKELISLIIDKDKKQFNKYNKNYANDPIDSSINALNTLYQTPKWRNHWSSFYHNMVYEKNFISYDEAIHSLRVISDEILNILH